MNLRTGGQLKVCQEDRSCWICIWQSSDCKTAITIQTFTCSTICIYLIEHFTKRRDCMHRNGSLPDCLLLYYQPHHQSLKQNEQHLVLCTCLDNPSIAFLHECPSLIPTRISEHKIRKTIGACVSSHERKVVKSVLKQSPPALTTYRLVFTFTFHDCYSKEIKLKL